MLDGRRRLDRLRRRFDRLGRRPWARSASGPHRPVPSPGRPATGMAADRATVTDALVVLGYLDPGDFLGGQMVLDADAAAAGVRAPRCPTRISARPRPPGASAHVASTDDAKAVRARLARRGLDPRRPGAHRLRRVRAALQPDIAAAVGAQVLRAGAGGRVLGLRRRHHRRASGAVPFPRRARCRSTAGSSARSAPRCGEVAGADLAADGSPRRTAPWRSRPTCASSVRAGSSASRCRATLPSPSMPTGRRPVPR